MMKKLRVLVLMHPQRLPPDDCKGSSAKEREEWQAEFDVVSTLRTLGHEVLPLGLDFELRPIREAVAAFKPDIAFNMLDEFLGEVLFDQHVVSYLEMTALPYTGCNPRGLTLSRDKALSKKILAYHRIPVPGFAVFPLRANGSKIRRPRGLGYPLIVKSLVEEASLGIAQASIVDNDDKLAERVRFVHESLKTDAIAEQYIDGREIYVGMVGTERLLSLPAWELVLDNLPPDAAPIATRKVKWDKAYQKRHKIVWRKAELAEEVAARLAHLSRRIYRSLNLSGYARLDFRVTPEGRAFLLEANPNPGIAHDDEVPDSAATIGISYPQLLQRILALGMRYVPGRGSAD
jgi:D-alanine-D-alanine ligase